MLQPFFAPQLAFPGGVWRKAGIDPAHSASKLLQKNFGDSVVSFGGGSLTSVLDGLPYAPTSAPTGAIIGTIGPTTKFSASGMIVSRSGQSTASVNSVTMAAICQFIAISGIQSFVGNGNSSSLSNVMLLNGGDLELYDGTLWTVSIPIAAKVPYFLCISCSPTTLNYLALNLNTGAIRSSTLAGTFNPRASTGSIYFGNNGAGTTQFMNGFMAAGACLQNVFLSKAQQLMWAADPWGFWYQPIKSMMLVGRGAFKAAWALNRNFLSEGVAT